MHGEPLRWKVTLKTHLKRIQGGLGPDPKATKDTHKEGRIVSFVSLATLELMLADPMPLQPSLSLSKEAVTDACPP
jgi:hypothetical protein